MITIDSVDVRGYPKGVLAGFVDAPAEGFSVEGHVLRIVGWAFGTDSNVELVEVGSTGRGILAQVALDRPRPDIELAFPTNPIVRNCGFDVAVSLLGVPSPFTLWVVATDGAGVRRHLATVSGRRSTVELPAGGGPYPVMVTTLGRTGSTWLTQLLGAHPEILALEPFRLEPRVVSYWAEVCSALARPSSYLAPLVSSEPETEDWWLGRGRTIEDVGAIPHLEHWLAMAHVTAVAAFCRDRIEAFYRSVSEMRGSAGTPRYVVEKFNPTWVPNLVWELFPAAKEIFLVRDFRDRLASVIDFNHRRGYEAFGRADFDSDEAFVREKVRSDAVTLLEAWRARRDRALLVRYEDMVLEPQQTAATILEYLGLASDAGSVTSMIEGSRLPDEQTAPHRTAVDAAASVGRWRHDLDGALQRVCDEALGPVLREFGYSTGERAS